MDDLNRRIKYVVIYIYIYIWSVDETEYNLKTRLKKKKKKQLEDQRGTFWTFEDYEYDAKMREVDVYNGKLGAHLDFQRRAP